MTILYHKYLFLCAYQTEESTAIVNVAKALDEGSLDKDPFLQQYRAKRIEELEQQASVGIRRYVCVAVGTEYLLYSGFLSGFYQRGGGQNRDICKVGGSYGASILHRF